MIIWEQKEYGRIDLGMRLLSSSLFQIRMLKHIEGKGEKREEEPDSFDAPILYIYFLDAAPLADNLFNREII